ncbi:MAG: penicillin acylase family protein [Anaerolineae bacterium]
MFKGKAGWKVILGVILLLALILVGAWLWLTRRPFPRVNGRVEVKGVSAPVVIYRDEYGVPHIYAETAEDLFFAQGYVQAQDRYFQMEFGRRVGAGRLSELFGEGLLESDIFLRTVGYHRVAEQEWAQADADFRQALEAFSAGVNAYTQSRPPGRLALEFALLGLQGVDVTVEPWTPVDTLTWQKVMSQSLSYSARGELNQMAMIPLVGLGMTADYYAPFRQTFPYIVPDAELEAMALLGDVDSMEATLADYARAGMNPALLGFTIPETIDLSAISPLGQDEGIGSNNWAISGDLTTTGMPILANDPHLGIQMPSIWYEVGLHCARVSEACPFNVRGYTFPSMPGVVIGHNDHIAWGVTNEGYDVLDLYIERINPENPNQYAVGDEWVDMEIVYEEIFIEGEEEPYVLPVRYTRNGPVMSDKVFEQRQEIFVGDDGSLQFTALAMRWTALEPNNTFKAVLLLNQAANYEAFREALTYWDGPGQNFVYADVEGNIAYQSTGLVPIRGAGDGSIPMPGWLNEYQWQGYIPFDDLPRSLNPEKGYVATANQNVVSSSYPYNLGTDFDPGYRAERIRQLIEGDTDGISPDDVAAMHGDNLNIAGLELQPYFEQLTFEDAALNDARNRLVEWDGRMDMDSSGAALYAFVWVELVHETFNDELPEEMWSSGGAGTMNTIFYMLEEPDNPWWDDRTTPDVVETRDDILMRALEQGYQTGVEELGSDLDRWRWGELHVSVFRNQTLGSSGIGLIEAIFNRGPVETAGGSSSVNATRWSTLEPFLVNSLPSMRQIIDLSDLASSRMIHTTGQSGHPYHRHYNDFIEMWRLIQYHPTNWTREMVEEDAHSELTLVPPGG